MKTYLSIWSGSNLSKSIRSGRNLWTIAQNASPFFQDEDMSRILTLGYPSVTLFAQTSSALAPFTAILNLYFWNFHNRHQRKESTRFYDNHWFETDTVRWWFDRLETILSLEERRRFGFRFITSAGLSWSAVYWSRASTFYTQAWFQGPGQEYSLVLGPTTQHRMLVSEALWTPVGHYWYWRGKWELKLSKWSGCSLMSWVIAGGSAISIH